MAGLDPAIIFIWTNTKKPRHFCRGFFSEQPLKISS
jgi:hypothetical protein